MNHRDPTTEAGAVSVKTVPFTVRIKRLHERAAIPTRTDPGNAGFDLYAVNGTVLYPNSDPEAIKLGFATAFSPGWVALIWDRSGMGRKGVRSLAGVIDSNYRGEWSVLLANLSTEPVSIDIGDRVAQVLFQRVEDAFFLEVDDLPDSTRGDRGFGSSGR